MLCFANDGRGKPRILALVLALGIGLGAADAIAQSSRDVPRAADPKEASLRMGETPIRGERQLPEMLFIVPGGRGRDVSTPHIRDYSFEILKPVVKPWLERDESLGTQVAERADSGFQSEPPSARESVGPPPRQRVRPSREPTLVPPRERRDTPRRDSVPVLVPEQ